RCPASPVLDGRGFRAIAYAGNVERCRPGQASGASADPGPITTGRNRLANGGLSLPRQLPLGVMGPCFRRDDTEFVDPAVTIRVSNPYAIALNGRGNGRRKTAPHFSGSCPIEDSLQFYWPRLAFVSDAARSRNGGFSADHLHAIDVSFT